MRLQSAIFSVEDALLGREDAEKVLSILKMEGVGLYAVTARERAETEEALRGAELWYYCRGMLTEKEAAAPLSESCIYEKAMRRLQSQPRGCASPLCAAPPARTNGASFARRQTRSWSAMRISCNEPARKTPRAL